MAAFIVSSFGLFVMSLFAGLFTAPSWQTFTVLAYGWAVASGERQTITTYLWLTGATTVKHFSRFYTFLGGRAVPGALAAVGADHPLRGAVGTAEGTPIVLHVDDSTKKKAGRQIEGWATIATVRARRAKNIARCAGSTLCGGSCACPCPAGRARVSVFPSACRSTSKRSRRDKLKLPISRAVPWPARSWTLSRPNSRRARFACWAMAAMPPRSTCTSYRPRSTWSRGCSSRASSMRCRLLRDNPAPRVSAQERPAAGVAENVGPQTVGLAAPSHRSRGARPSVDRAVAYRAAGAPDPRGGGPPSAAAPRPQSQASANRRPRWRRFSPPISR